MEFKSGVMATLTSANNEHHISLCYFTNEIDYIVFVVAARTTNYTYWAQYDDKQEAVNDYQAHYQKIFNR